MMLYHFIGRMTLLVSANESRISRLTSNSETNEPPIHVVLPHLMVGLLPFFSSLFPPPPPELQRWEVCIKEYAEYPMLYLIDYILLSIFI